MSKSWKTRWCSLLLVLSMLAGLCVPAYAAPEGGTESEQDASVSRDTEVGDSTVTDKTLATTAETEDVVWSNNFDTTVADNTGKWENNLAPSDLSLGNFAMNTMKIGLDGAVYHSASYSVHVTGDGSGRVAALRAFSNFDCTKNYVLRAWVKTDNCKSASSSWRGPRFEVQFYQSKANPKSIASPTAIEGTFDWQKVELELPSETLIACNNGANTGNMQILFDCNLSSGDIWIDDLELVCTGTPEAPDPEPEPEPEPDPDPDEGEPEQPKGPSAVLEGYPSTNAVGVESFENLKMASGGKTEGFWAYNRIPEGWTDIYPAGTSTAIKDSEKNMFEVVSSEKLHGDYSIHVHSTGGAQRDANVIKSNVLDYSKDYKFRAWVKYNITAGKVTLRTQVGKNGNAAAWLKDITGSSNGEWVLIEGDMTGLQALADSKTPGDKSGNVKIEVYPQSFAGDFWIDAIEFVPDYRINLNTTSVKLETGKTVQLNATISGTNENLPITWTSSDTSIATVDENGLVTAVGGGLAEIKASTDEKHSAVCNVQVPDPAMEATFASMREKWVDRLTGNAYAGTSARAEILAGWDEAAKDIQTKLVKGSATSLFSDLTLDIQSDLRNKANSTTSSDSEPYFTAMDRIQTMAKVWAAEGSRYYHDNELKDDILYALDWMEEHAYNAQLDNQAMFGNWYHWWISLPQSLAGTVILMHDEMSPDLLDREAAVLARFNEDPIYVYKVKNAAGKMDMTGANLADTSLASLLRAAACSDQEAAANGTKYFDQVVQVVTSGDGIYADGSFIQHGDLAYTGGYGSTLLSGAEKMLYMSTGTQWAVDPDDVEIVYNFIWNGVRPLYADGAVFDMTNGRGVARPSSADIKTGRVILWSIVLLSDSAPAEYQGKLKSFAKGQLEAGVEAMGAEEYFNHSNVAAVIASQALLADSSVTADPNTGYAKVFGSMDKAVAHSEKFSLGVSYASSRMSRFEFGNEENKQGWHQSDGAVYLYYGDPKQYADNYWNTVDPHRLAGITTDGSEWTPVNWGSYPGSGAFNGGSVSGPYMSLAQDFKNYTQATNPDLAAKKSWFVFDGEVVALGAGITGVNGSAETIVDNKKINGGNDFVVDGEKAIAALGDSSSVEGAQWAWLAGNTSADSIGYFFPEKADLNLLREARSSDWTNVNGAAKGFPPQTRNYLSIAIPHDGAEGDSYSYVLLPGMSQAETQAYAANSALTILSNTAQLQAVADSGANAAGFTFWQAGEAQMPEGGEVASVASDSPASVTLYQKDGKIYVGVSDPSQKGSSIKITLTGESLTLGALDEGVTGTKTETGVELTVSVSGLRGETLTAQLGGGTSSGGSSGGSSSGSSGGGSSSSNITVPVSGDKNSVDVKASVSGSTATVDKIDTAHLNEVTGSDVDTGMVEIDFTGLKKPVNTVNLPAGAVKEIAKAAKDNANDTEGLTIKLSTGAAAFDAAALDAVQEQASGTQITLSIVPARDSDLSARQKEVVDGAPVYDLTMRSAGKAITSFGKGNATISLPHTLKEGQDPSGVVVYYLDNAGNIHRCDTMYDVPAKMAVFTTNHLSLYVVGYENNPFTDVAANDYFFDAVLWAVEKGITSGTSATAFSPNSSCTRGQMVTFLWRAAGSPAPKSGNTPFTDIQSGAYYYDAVCWAVEQGITSGTSATTFSPDAVVTRGQAVTFLHAYAGAPAPSGSNPFKDVDAGAYYSGPAVWAAENEITFGTGPDTFSPNDACTRGQIVSFLYRGVK